MTCQNHKEAALELHLPQFLSWLTDRPDKWRWLFSCLLRWNSYSCVPCWFNPLSGCRLFTNQTTLSTLLLTLTDGNLSYIHIDSKHYICHIYPQQCSSSTVTGSLVCWYSGAAWLTIPSVILCRLITERSETDMKLLTEHKENTPAAAVCYNYNSYLQYILPWSSQCHSYENTISPPSAVIIICSYQSFHKIITPWNFTHHMANPHLIESRSIIAEL